MDAWLHGPALVALWVIAVGVAISALLLFMIWLKVGEMARVVAPSPLDRQRAAENARRTAA